MNKAMVVSILGMLVSTTIIGCGTSTSVASKPKEPTYTPEEQQAINVTKNFITNILTYTDFKDNQEKALAVVDTSIKDRLTKELAYEVNYDDMVNKQGLNKLSVVRNVTIDNVQVEENQDKTKTYMINYEVSFDPSHYVISKYQKGALGVKKTANDYKVTGWDFDQNWQKVSVLGLFDDGTVIPKNDLEKQVVDINQKFINNLFSNDGSQNLDTKSVEPYLTDQNEIQGYQNEVKAVRDSITKRGGNKKFFTAIDELLPMQLPLTQSKWGEDHIYEITTNIVAEDASNKPYFDLLSSIFVHTKDGKWYLWRQQWNPKPQDQIRVYNTQLQFN